MALTVRPLVPGDERALRRLCLETTPLRARREVERFVILQTYCMYYLERELTHCFAAEEGGELRAALLCAPDFAAYERRFLQNVQPKFTPYGMGAAANARQVALLHRSAAGQYPAHCVPMFSEGLPGEAIAALFEALRAHLEGLGCRGVCAFTAKNQYALREALELLGFEPVSRKNGMDTLGKIFD